MPDEGEDADAIGTAGARRMLEGDRVSHGLGITLVSAGAGRAVLEMTVRQDMLDGFGTCHGESSTLSPTLPCPAPATAAMNVLSPIIVR
jgi:hypothetical protein